MSKKAGILIFTLSLTLLLNGCCGMTNVQAHGGGAGGLASLGALIVGTTAMQKLCEPEKDSGQDEDVPPPPETEENPS